MDYLDWQCNGMSLLEEGSGSEQKTITETEIGMMLYKLRNDSYLWMLEEASQEFSPACQHLVFSSVTLLLDP